MISTSSTRETTNNVIAVVTHGELSLCSSCAAAIPKASTPSDAMPKILVVRSMYRSTATLRVLM
jgi:hypothetical protein